MPSTKKDNNTQIATGAIFKAISELALYSSNKSSHSNDKKTDFITALRQEINTIHENIKTSESHGLLSAITPEVTLNASTILKQVENLLLKAKEEFPTTLYDRTFRIDGPEGIQAIDSALAVINAAQQKIGENREEEQASLHATPPTLAALGLRAVKTPFDKSDAITRLTKFSDLISYFKENEKAILADADAENIISTLFLHMIKVHFNQNYVNATGSSIADTFIGSTSNRLAVIQSRLNVTVDDNTDEITNLRFKSSLSVDGKIAVIEQLIKALDQSKGSKSSKLGIALNNIILKYQRNINTKLKGSLNEVGETLENQSIKADAGADSAKIVVEAHNSNAERAQQDIAASDAILKRIEGIETSINTNVQDIEQQLKQLAATQTEVTQLESEAQTLCDTVERDQKTLTDLNQTIDLIDSFSGISPSTVENLKTDFTTLDRTLIDLRSSFGPDSGSANVSAETIAEITRTHNKLMQIQRRLNTLNVAAEEHASFQAFAKDLETTIEDAQSLSKHLLASARAVTLSHEHTTNKIGKINTRLAQYQKDVTTLKTNVASLKTRQEHAKRAYTTTMTTTLACQQAFQSLSKVQRSVATTARQAGGDVHEGTPITSPHLFLADGHTELRDSILNAKSFESLRKVFNASEAAIKSDKNYSLAVLLMHRMAELSGETDYNTTQDALIARNGSFYHLVSDVFAPMAERLSEHRSGEDPSELGSALSKIINLVEYAHQHVLRETAQDVEAKQETLIDVSHAVLEKTKLGFEAAQDAYSAQDESNGRLSLVAETTTNLHNDMIKHEAEAKELKDDTSLRLEKVRELQSKIEQQREALALSMSDNEKLKSVAEKIKEEIQNKQEVISKFVTAGITTIDDSLKKLETLNNSLASKQLGDDADSKQAVDIASKIAPALNSIQKIREQLSRMPLTSEQQTALNAKVDKVATALSTLKATQHERLTQASAIIRKLSAAQVSNTQAAQKAAANLSALLTGVRGINELVDGMVLNNQLTTEANVETKAAHKGLIEAAEQQVIEMHALPKLSESENLSWDAKIKAVMRELSASLIAAGKSDSEVAATVKNVAEQFVSNVIISHLGKDNMYGTDIKKDALKRAITDNISAKSVNTDRCVDDIIAACQIRRGAGRVFGSLFTKPEQYESVKAIRGGVESLKAIVNQTVNRTGDESVTQQNTSHRK